MTTSDSTDVNVISDHLAVQALIRAYQIRGKFMEKITMNISFFLWACRPQHCHSGPSWHQ